MKIKSKFKDYYDYISYQYGGGDDKCIYERTPLNTGYFHSKSYSLLQRMKSALYLPQDIGQTGKWIIVDGEAFHISKNSVSGEWQLSLEDTPLIHNGWWLDDRDVIFVRFKRPEFTEWCKLLQTPVFLIESINARNGDVFVTKNVPVLQDYGFARIIPAEQMYQNISMFITNELTEQMEMPTMTDKEKIASHGFDGKTSFRGK